MAPGRSSNWEAGGPRAAGRRQSVALGGLLFGGDLLAFLAVSAIVELPVGVIPVAASIATVTGWAYAGLYRFRCSLSVLDDLPSLLTSVLVAIAVTSILVLLTNAVDDQRRTVAFALAFGAAAALLRVVTYATARRLRLRGVFVQRAIVVGPEGDRRRLVRDLVDHPECGLRVVGPDSGPTPTNGSSSDVLLNTGGVDAVIVASGDDGHEPVDLQRRYNERGLDVYVVGGHHLGSANDRMWRRRLTRLRPPAFRRPSWRAKRMLDVLLASAALVALAPLLLATALAVRLTVGRPVIFRQERVGCGAKRFTMLKFRTLHPVNEKESRTRWTIVNDQRIGRIGRVLRATSLDELPQLINVVRGDMSIVGPRPERAFFARQFARDIPRYDDRHRVPGGITGLAAVHGLRGDTSIEDRADFDNYYIENWSLWMDVKIIIQTIPALLRRSESPSCARFSTVRAVMTMPSRRPRHVTRTRSTSAH